VACHAEAETWEATDWPQILLLYDALYALLPTPVVGLHRAIALRQVAGPAVALAELDALAGPLAGYHLLHATRAQPLRDLGRASEARVADERALGLTGNPAERAFSNASPEAPTTDLKGHQWPTRRRHHRPDPRHRAAPWQAHRRLDRADEGRLAIQAPGRRGHAEERSRDYPRRGAPHRAAGPQRRPARGGFAHGSCGCALRRQAGGPAADPRPTHRHDHDVVQSAGT
jgi:hypothetical protein